VRSRVYFISSSTRISVSIVLYDDFFLFIVYNSVESGNNMGMRGLMGFDFKV
jgi:hypothetical protein